MRVIEWMDTYVDHFLQRSCQFLQLTDTLADRIRVSDHYMFIFSSKKRCLSVFERFEITQQIHIDIKYILQSVLLFKRNWFQLEWRQFLRVLMNGKTKQVTRHFGQVYVSGSII